MGATRHSYVGKCFSALFPLIGEVEDEMLGCVTGSRTSTKCLSCQLTMPDRDIMAKIPANQI
ncbi:hypothetical protein [Sphingobium xenophagum]|uniref:hypothetical protein n=1 Tax=Sphingobium xenophagum TaxID=121428 RepID=UPI00241BF11A|nr:hypothetical protein [Sphingobium xenophagum]